MQMAMTTYVSLAGFDYWENDDNGVTAHDDSGDGAFMSLVYEDGRITAHWGDDTGTDCCEVFCGDLDEGNTKSLAFDLLSFLGE